MVARSAGVENVELEDFLFDPLESDDGPPPTDDEVAAYFRFKPRNVKV